MYKRIMCFNAPNVINHFTARRAKSITKIVGVGICRLFSLKMLYKNLKDFNVLKT